MLPKKYFVAPIQRYIFFNDNDRESVCRNACVSAEGMIRKTLDDLRSTIANTPGVHDALTAIAKAPPMRMYFNQKRHIDKDVNKIRIIFDNKSGIPIGDDISHLIKITISDNTSTPYLSIVSTDKQFSQVITLDNITSQNLAHIIHDIAVDIYIFNVIFDFSALLEGIPTFIGEYISQEKHAYASSNQYIAYGHQLNSIKGRYVSFASLCRANPSDEGFSISTYLTTLVSQR